MHYASTGEADAPIKTLRHGGPVLSRETPEGDHQRRPPCGVGLPQLSEWAHRPLVRPREACRACELRRASDVMVVVSAGERMPNGRRHADASNLAVAEPVAHRPDPGVCRVRRAGAHARPWWRNCARWLGPHRFDRWTRLRPGSRATSRAAPASTFFRLRIWTHAVRGGLERHLRPLPLVVLDGCDSARRPSRGPAGTRPAQGCR